jgi:Spy/CpxP family protein refolding chaperone
VALVLVVLGTIAPAFGQSVKKQSVTAGPVFKEKSALVAPLQAKEGTWWRNPVAAMALGLTADQQKKMDEIVQQSRLKLIDLNASVEKEEAVLEPLIEGERADEARVLSQIDRVAQARAELEKANARMLLGIRQVLTQEQWAQLSSSSTIGSGKRGAKFIQKKQF